MDNRFYYYLHGSTASTPDEIRDILDNGLKSRFKFSLGSTMWRIDGEGDLEEKIKSYSKSEKFDAVFVNSKRLFASQNKRRGCCVNSNSFFQKDS